MRIRWALFFCCFVPALTLYGAADTWLGDWRSGDPAKPALVNIESDNTGGYLVSTRSTAGDGKPAYLAYRVRLDGQADEGSLKVGDADHFTKITSRRAGDSTIVTEFRDYNDGALLRTHRMERNQGNLILSATGVDGQPVWDFHFTAVKPVSLTDGPQPFGPVATVQYSIDLTAGDLLEVSAEQKDGAANVILYDPHGVRLQRFGGGPAKSVLVWEALESGPYLIALRGIARSSAAPITFTVDRLTHWKDRKTATPAVDKPTSPRLIALAKENSPAALDTFWKEIAKNGSPLIETLKDEPDDLVTFLWRGLPITRSVEVVWFPYTPAQPDNYRMARLGDSDVWYRSVKVRKGARFVYTLLHNDPPNLREQADDFDHLMGGDPLNPLPWFDGPGMSRFERVSRVEMPGAPSQPYIVRREGVPAGRLERSRFKSQLLDNERTITVYTPPGYKRDGQPYNLMFVFDESAYLTNVPTPVILDNLTAEGRIAPMVAVLIANPNQATRSRELPHNAKFADFLATELMPWVRSHYNVTNDPSHTVVAGSSFGGIASVYAGMRHPEVFGNILCQSGSFWWKGEKPAKYDEPTMWAREIIESPKLPLKFYMDAGSFEIDATGSGGSILEPSRHVRDVLRAKGYEVHYQENVGGHDYLSWRGSLADGLLALMGRPKP